MADDPQGGTDVRSAQPSSYYIQLYGLSLHTFKTNKTPTKPQSKYKWLNKTDMTNLITACKHYMYRSVSSDGSKP